MPIRAFPTFLHLPFEIRGQPEERIETLVGFSPAGVARFELFHQWVVQLVDGRARNGLQIGPGFCV